MSGKKVPTLKEIQEKVRAAAKAAAEAKKAVDAAAEAAEAKAEEEAKAARAAEAKAEAEAAERVEKCMAITEDKNPCKANGPIRGVDTIMGQLRLCGRHFNMMKGVTPVTPKKATP